MTRQAGGRYRAAMGNAGVIDQHVDATITLDHQSHCALHRLCIANIATKT